MLKQARSLIKECLETQSTYLDLGNCGITDLNDLPELFACTHLETLVLSSEWYELDQGHYIRKQSKNNGPGNAISLVPGGLSNLKKLTQLICAGQPHQTWAMNGADALAELSNLKSLYLDSNTINDLSFLEKLTSLQSLSLSDNQVTDYSFLKKLSSLQSLNLSYNKIPNYDFLERHLSLQSLDLSYNQIIDLRFLEKLSSLDFLELSGNQITNISALNKLSFLRYLGLGDNQVTDVSSLKKLPSLQSLYLFRNRITDITFLKGLTSLQSLSLNDNQITDISPLKVLALLQFLDLSNNPITDLGSLKQLVNLPKLKTLRMYSINENNLNIPPEQFGDSAHANCLENLRGYFASIKKGATRAYEVPVILVGNSTAGKTSLLEFMRHQTFPPAFDHSTHGVVPTVWIPDLAMLGETEEQPSEKQLQLYCWDFGGQEYYHATHRLFFSRRAIYVLLWEQKTNAAGVQMISIRIKDANDDIQESEQPVALFPYSYWLKTIRAYAPEADYSPLILVQNKLDEAGNDQKDYPGGDFRDQYGISDVFHLSVKEAYATQPDGLIYQEYQSFLRHLLDLAQDQQARHDRQTHWEAFKLVLQERRQENIWTRSEFLQALQTLDSDIEEGSMVSYGLSLHSMGFIFYYHDDKRLGDYVFINPEWVVENIYGILDDTVRTQGGEFAREKVVQQLGDEYADVFIALMKKFELIFENPEASVYIAPQYLPETCTDTNILMAYRAALPGTPSLIVYFPDYMPPSLIQRLIAEFGDRAIGKVYWKYGGLFLLENQHVLIESQPDERRLLFTAKEHHPAVLWAAFAAMRDKTDRNDRLYVSLDQGAHFLKIADIEQQRRLGNREAKVETLKGDSCSIAAYNFLFESQKPATSSPMPTEKKTQQVFISYSHDDTAYRKELQQYLVNLERDGTIKLWQDGLIQPGDAWDTKIKDSLEQADIIILLVSQSFIASNYVHEVEMRTALERAANGNARIIPVLLKNCDWAQWKVLPDTLNEQQVHEGKGSVGTYQFFPMDENQRLKAVNRWEFKEDVWTQLANYIRGIA